MAELMVGFTLDFFKDINTVPPGLCSHKKASAASQFKKLEVKALISYERMMEVPLSSILPTTSVKNPTGTVWNPGENVRQQISP